MRRQPVVAQANPSQPSAELLSQSTKPFLKILNLLAQYSKEQPICGKEESGARTGIRTRVLGVTVPDDWSIRIVPI